MARRKKAVEEVIQEEVIGSPSKAVEIPPADLSPYLTKEAINYFKKRTEMHIALVRKYAHHIEKAFPIYSGLYQNSAKHDDLKFQEPERSPYIVLSWKKKIENSGREFQIPEDVKDAIWKATEHHIKNSPHHPEYFQDKNLGLLNKNDRDGIPEVAIDATLMPDIYVAEMVADWMAMSEELGTSLTGWIDKVVGKRWKFSEKQKGIIDEIVGFFKLSKALAG